MCGIAGIVDLAGQRAAPPGALAAMAAALYHRGPDEGGFLERDGVAFASRRLSVVGLKDGRQPIANEDRSVWVVYNGELFDHPEKRAALEAKGHRFRTSTDTELLPHLWEEYGETMLEDLRGQFAFALWDSSRNVLILARDRFGICPLFYTLRRDGDGWSLLFASEVKGLLASGLVEARPDLRGLNHTFTFFGTPGPVTCFEGVRSLPPAQYLRVPLGPDTRPDDLKPHFYWEMDFPDRGQEEDGDAKRVVDRFEQVLLASVERRLRADVPVVSYLSGGVDSSQIVAMASRILGRPIPTFTISIADPALNEETEAVSVSRLVGSELVIVPFSGRSMMTTYPELIRAAEAPVIDTASAAMMELAKSVHGRGYKVALTGTGPDEYMAGYSWFKLHRIMSWLDIVPELSLRVRRGLLRLAGVPRFPWPIVRRNIAAVGGYNPWLDAFGVISLSRLLFYSEDMRASVGDHVAYEDLEVNREKMARWHPLNRALAIGTHVLLAGMLLSSKGDRVGMHSSVETRHPFLDEDVFTFIAGLHPRWKLRGFKDKYVLRLLAERWLPKSVAWRRKVRFRAPMDDFHAKSAPPFVHQLLSEEALRRTGYFDPAAVRHWRAKLPMMRRGLGLRIAIEMGLVGVIATQLWHQVFVDSSLADVPAGGSK